MTVALFSTMSLLLAQCNAIESYQQARTHTISQVKRRIVFREGDRRALLFQRKWCPVCLGRILLASFSICSAKFIVGTRPGEKRWRSQRSNSRPAVQLRAPATRPTELAVVLRIPLAPCMSTTRCRSITRHGSQTSHPAPQPKKGRRARSPIAPS